jgi:hypothetical protein
MYIPARCFAIATVTSAYPFNIAYAASLILALFTTTTIKPTYNKYHFPDSLSLV